MQRHEVSSNAGTSEGPLSESDQGRADDYHPESLEECGPAWTRSHLADDLSVNSEPQDDMESPVDIDSMLNLAHPTLWVPAFEQLHTLNPQMPVGGTVLNFFLMTKWCPTHGLGPLQYADIMTVAPPIVNNLGQMPNLDEIQTFQQRHFVPPSQKHPVAQVGFILDISQHYCMAIFDYCRQSAHIMGHHVTSEARPEISSQSNWEEWHGPTYWKRLAILHDWPHGDPFAVHVHEDPRFRLPLASNCDCGPIACSILEHFLDKGLSHHVDGSLQRPTIPCGHTTCLRIFEMVKLSCRHQWHHYLYLDGHLPDNWDPTDRISKAALETRMEVPQQMVHNHQVIVTQLATMLYNCPNCRPNLTRTTTSISSSGLALGNVIQNDEGLDLDSEDHNPIMNFIRSDQMTDNLKQLLDSHSLTSSTHIHDMDTRLSRWLPFNPTFDQYWGGPTLESMRPIMDAGEIWSSSHNAWISVLGSSMLFRDYGYRILPSFSQMFWLGPPVDTLNCMMGIGVSDTYDPSWQVSHWNNEGYSLSYCSLFPDDRTVVIRDVHIMGASEMLLHANQLVSENAEIYETLFMYGAYPITNHWISLDLELDMDIPEEIDILVDIDSYIWVTQDFCPALSIGIYLAPVIEQNASIHKHNHVYVDILMPQSAENQGLYGAQRNEWWTKSVPLSSIPHEASSSSLPYVDTMVHEIRYKSRKGGSSQPGSQRPKATLVSRVAFERIQKKMRTRIKGQAMLAPYGSFFFVLEGKGIKLWTKDSQDGRYDMPYQALKDYMMDRNHGELYLDVGVSFNPTGQFVGLWRLDALKASFEKGGFRKGTTHHTSTLGHYGGIQAEMRQAHSRSSQICFRSAYQLCYKTIRPNNNEPKFVSNRDAYNLTKGYLKECKWTQEIYSAGPSLHAYGCHDEYQISGQAALEVLPHLKEWAGGLEIVSEDSADVRKIMGANAKSHCKTWTLPDPTTSSNNWPIGPQPSWKDVVKMIEDHPQLLMRHWVYDPIWDPGDSDVGLLFIQFTREFWLQLAVAHTTNNFVDAAIINPRICNNLEEAMTCWSLDRINQWIISIQFQACSAGLEGDKPGRPHLSFVQRRTTFFPSEDSAPLQSSKWKTYWTEGYIAQYHELCSGLSEARLLHLHDRLDILFTNLQCLPDVNKPTAKSPGSTWTLASGHDSIKIVTNSYFYRIQRIGACKCIAKRPAVLKRPLDFQAAVMQMQGRDPRRNKPKNTKKTQIDRRSMKAKNSRKPPNRPIKISVGPQKTLASPEASSSNTSIWTQTRDELDHQHKNAEVEGDSEKSGDDDESETNSLFDYDGSDDDDDDDDEEEEEEKEEGNDPDISTF
ncbi:hypothetical protein BDR06DRAFT_969416 [Suillus hirtellus]|nr:hypothetical protein BDR06DRAFT_969416 [Suillus hirtellus]